MCITIRRKTAYAERYKILHSTAAEQPEALAEATVKADDVFSALTKALSFRFKTKKEESKDQGYLHL